MGQYYSALVKRGDKIKNYNIQVEGYKKGEGDGFEDIDYDKYNGIKLMEHSYWRNSFMLAMTAELYKHKARVAWVGDYASDYRFERDDAPDPRTLCELAWDKIKQEPIAEQDMTLEDMVLVNHTKKQYVDGNEYYEYNKFKWGEDTPWSCIHPLSLLTACGNGLGGGDYHEDNPDYNFVGYWCWDEISVEDASTFDKTGYKLLTLDFCENGLKRSETYERANNESV